MLPRTLSAAYSLTMTNRKVSQSRSRHANHECDAEDIWCSMVVEFESGEAGSLMMLDQDRLQVREE